MPLLPESTQWIRYSCGAILSLQPYVYVWPKLDMESCERHPSRDRGSPRTTKIRRSVWQCFPKRAYVDCYIIGMLHHCTMNISFVSLAVLQKNVLGSNYKSFWSFCIFGGWFNNAPFVKRCRLISEPATAKLSSSWCGGQGYSEPPGGFHWTTRPSKIVNRKPKLGGLSLVTRGWCNICSQCLLEHAGCTSPTRYVGNCITKEKQLPYQLEYQKNTCLVARAPCCLMIMIALLPSFTSFRKGLANHLRI